MLRSRPAEWAAGLGVYLAALIMQLQAVTWPQCAYDFAAYRAVITILAVHLAITAAVCLIALLAEVCGCSGTVGRIGRLVGWMRVGWVGVSVGAAWSGYGGLGWTVVFAASMAVCMESFFGVARMRQTWAASVAQVAGLATVGVACTLGLSRQPVSQTLEQLTPLLLEVLVASVLTAIFHHGERVRWRRARRLRKELSRLRRILRDLIPAHIARRMITQIYTFSFEPANAAGEDGRAHGPAKAQVAVGERCRAAVLQLDLCGFTRLSQTLSALDVARLVHRIFSRLDCEVRELRLFKMDTVGDAYIVAGFLPDPTSASTGANDSGDGPGRARARVARRTRRVCERVLRLGGVALEELAAVRHDTGLDLRGRVGLAVGEVMVGSLGRLQPRIHIRGPGMLAAEGLEQSGRENAVHVSETYLRALRAGAGLGLGGVRSRAGCGGSSSTVFLSESGDGSRAWIPGPFDATPERRGSSSSSSGADEAGGGDSGSAWEEHGERPAAGAQAVSVGKGWLAGVPRWLGWRGPATGVGAWGDPLEAGGGQAPPLAPPRRSFQTTTPRPAWRGPAGCAAPCPVLPPPGRARAPWAGGVAMAVAWAVEGEDAGVEVGWAPDGWLSVEARRNPGPDPASSPSRRFSLPGPEGPSDAETSGEAGSWSSYVLVPQHARAGA